MRIRLAFTLEVTRRRSAPDEPPPGALNDNDGTLVEHAGPQRMGFTIPHAAPPLDPGEDDRERRA